MSLGASLGTVASMKGAQSRSGTRPPAGPPAGGPAPDRQEGAAAVAIRDAETSLAHQDSATAQLDLQVVTAILNAHLSAVQGRHALNQLQHDVESAVQNRTDLNTPAGARDFQRFLVGKLNDIRAVVAGASLDDTSKSALMAAWTSLYNVSKSEPGSRRPPPAVAAGSPSQSDTEPSPLPDAAMDPYIDSLLADDPGFLPGDAPVQTPAPIPAPSVMPGIPGLGGAMPGAMPGWGVPGGLPLPGLPQAEKRSADVLDEEPLPLEMSEERPPCDESDEPGEPDEGEKDQAAESPGPPEAQSAGPTTVTLSDGETVTAASPQLAAAIEAAAGGTPIADAFRQHGIAIPPPGTAVTDPVDLAQVVPGDIGMFTDRHALALGRSKALLDGQIQHISTVSGPSFLGWEHPPAPATTPARAETPTPTRPAVAVSTSR